MPSPACSSLRRRSPAGPVGRPQAGCHLAYSTERVSRMTVTLIWPLVFLAIASAEPPEALTYQIHIPFPSRAEPVAAEVGFSETAFVVPDAADPRQLTVRYFSALAEVPFTKPDGSRYVNDDDDWEWLSEHAAKAARWPRSSAWCRRTCANLASTAGTPRPRTCRTASS